MTLNEIKNYLQKKASNFINQVFEDDGTPMHLAVIGILYQTIKNYDGEENKNITVNLDNISEEKLDNIIMYVEDEYLWLTLSDIVGDDYTDETITDNIEKVIYWKVADIVDILKE